jgi:hypothetical protein
MVGTKTFGVRVDKRAKRMSASPVAFICAELGVSKGDLLDLPAAFLDATIADAAASNQRNHPSST